MTEQRSLLSKYIQANGSSIVIHHRTFNVDRIVDHGKDVGFTATFSTIRSQRIALQTLATPPARYAGAEVWSVDVGSRFLSFLITTDLRLINTR